MFLYIVLTGFFGFLIYASSFAYALLNKKEGKKKNGVRMLICLAVIICGLTGLQLFS